MKWPINWSIYPQELIENEEKWAGKKAGVVQK